MKAYYQIYSTRDTLELNEILNAQDELVFPAKIALLKRIETDSLQKEFNAEKIKQLKTSIGKERDDIKNLKYLAWLGIDLFEKSDSITIRKSKSAKLRDWVSTIIGVILSLVIIAAIPAWIDLFMKGFSVAGFVSALILSGICIVGIQLLIRSVDRSLNLKGFRLIKDSTGIQLKNCPETTIKNETYSLDTKLELENGDNLKLVLSTGEKKIDILSFTNLEITGKESLTSMAEKFNETVF